MQVKFVKFKYIHFTFRYIQKDLRKRQAIKQLLLLQISNLQEEIEFVTSLLSAATSTIYSCHKLSPCKLQ